MFSRSSLNSLRSLYSNVSIRVHKFSSIPEHKQFRVIESNVAFNSSCFEKRKQDNLALENVYHERLKRSYAGGGPKAVERHVVRNKKMLVRDRLKNLLDEKYPFLELSPLAGLDMDYGDVPSAGMVSGIGKISGQLCIICANDATVKGGTAYPIGVKKQLRMQEIAMQNNLPCVYIVDSGGGYLPLQSELFPDSQHGGRVFFNEAIMSSTGIPQICIVAGSSTAGGAYIPTMSDETVIIHKIGSLYLAGPPLVQAATGEVVSSEDLGGARVHCEESGCIDYFAETEVDALDYVKNIMLTLNMHSDYQEPDIYEEPKYPTQQLNLLAGYNTADTIVNMYDILARVLDGSRFHEFRERFGPSLITGFGHVCGHLVGIVANNGVLGYKSSLKGAHFVELCWQRDIPLLFFQNTETQGNDIETDINTINAKSKMMACVANASVPKITVIVGKSIGEDSFAMCGRSMSPRFLYCWPRAEISSHDTLVMEQLWNEAALEGCIGPTELKCGIDFWANVKRQSNCFYLESRMCHDGVILPADTRKVLGLSLTATLAHQRTLTSTKSVLRM